MLELRPIEVFEQVWPRPKVLLPGHNVQFSQGFPSALDFIKGKTVKISKTTQVSYELSSILPALHYLDVNLSNEDSGQKLYPESTDEFYETLVGFKSGNWFALLYFPSNQPVYRLGYNTMTPVISDASLKYIGAIRPEDSPVNNPILKLYTFYKLSPIIARITVDDGIDFDKMTMVISINKCKFEEYTPQKGEPVKYIPYLTELQW